MRTKKFDLSEYLSGEKAVFQNKVIQLQLLKPKPRRKIVMNEFLKYENFEWWVDGTPKNFTPKEWDGKLKLLKA